MQLVLQVLHKQLLVSSSANKVISSPNATVSLDFVEVFEVDNSQMIEESQELMA